MGDVYIANTVAFHVAHVFGTLHACGKPALAETPACRRPKTTDSLVGCELHTYMYDLPAWVELRYAGPSRIFVRCRSAGRCAPMCSAGASAGCRTGANVD